MGSDGLFAEGMDERRGRMGPCMTIGRDTDVGSAGHVSVGKSDGDALPSFAAVMVVTASVPSSRHPPSSPGFARVGYEWPGDDARAVIPHPPPPGHGPMFRTKRACPGWPDRGSCDRLIQERARCRARLYEVVPSNAGSEDHSQRSWSHDVALQAFGEDVARRPQTGATASYRPGQRHRRRLEDGWRGPAPLLWECCPVMPAAVRSIGKSRARGWYCLYSLAHSADRTGGSPTDVPPRRSQLPSGRTPLRDRNNPVDRIGEPDGARRGAPAPAGQERHCSLP